MLTFNDASKILGLCQIPFDIQNKILLLFIGFGTPISQIIKSQIKCLDTSFNGSLVERIILQNEMTLWKFKVFLNGGISSYNLCIKNLRAIYELRIAYLSNVTNELERMANISDLKNAIKTSSDYDLFVLFYNLDKDKYSYLGTPTANIIHNAISNNIIYEFNHIINYDTDSDDF